MCGGLAMYNPCDSGDLSSNPPSAWTLIACEIWPASW